MQMRHGAGERRVYNKRVGGMAELEPGSGAASAGPDSQDAKGDWKDAQGRPVAQGAGGDQVRRPVGAEKAAPERA